MKQRPLRRQLEQQQQGGSSSSPAIASAPTPTPAPPVSSTNQQVVQAELDTARQNLMKKSIKNTIYAGDTAYKAGEVGSPGNPGSGPSSYKKTLG
jgi:hypothetical protein